MELKIYFDNKYVLLTDSKSTKKNENLYECFEKCDIQAAIRAIETTGTNHVSIFHNDFQILLENFKSLFTYIEAAGGLITNEKNELLFIYRRGKWDLPKGKLETGERPTEAAIREVQEETGLMNITLKEYRCSTWHTYPLKGQNILKQTYWYNMFASKNQPSAPQVEEDISELEWVNEAKINSVLGNTYPSIISVIDKDK